MDSPIRILGEDIPIINGFYFELNPASDPKRLNLSPREFIGAIEGRIYTEQSLERPPQDYSHYKGGAYGRWVSDEKLFESTRRRDRGTPFRPEDNDREVTLRALTSRAIDYFKAYGSKGDEKPKGENLRCSLEPWMED